MESVIAIQGNRKIINCAIKVVVESFINVSICLKILRLLDAVIFFSILQYSSKFFNIFEGQKAIVERTIILTTLAKFGMTSTESARAQSAF